MVVTLRGGCSEMGTDGGAKHPVSRVSVGSSTNRTPRPGFLQACVWGALVSTDPHPLKMGFSALLLLQGRLILSNKTARTVAFFYTLFLHCLVFLVSTGAAGGWMPQ